MANENINIRLTLKDEFTSSMGKVSKTFKSMEKDIKHIGREMNQLGSSMLMLGGVITAPFALSLRTASKYSLEAYNVTKQYERSLESLQVSVANSVLPVFKKLADELAVIVNRFNSLNPAIRDNVMQTVLWGGVMLVAAGSVLKVAASLIKIVEVVPKIGKVIFAVFGGGGTFGLVLVGLGSAVFLMYEFIDNWDKIRDKVNVVAPLIDGALAPIKATLFSMLGTVQMIIAKVEKMIPGLRNEGKILEEIANQNLKKAADAYIKEQAGGTMKALDGMSDFLKRFKKQVADIYALFKGEGDKSTPGTQGKTFFGGFQLGMQQMIDKFADMHAAGLAFAQTLAQGMQSSFSDLFFNVMKGKFDDLGKVFESFADMVMRAIANMMAQMLALQALQAVMGMFGGGNQKSYQTAGGGGSTVGYAHSGGVIKKFHSGGVADVPAILQEGEGVVSRKGMAVLGTSNLKKLNNGQGSGGGTTIVIAPTIQAWDMQDIYRNKEAIVGIMTESLSRNGALRGAIKRYA